MAKIQGTWDAYLDDFIINYDGERRIGTVAYGERISKRGYVRARVWHDADQDGVRDKGEKIIAMYRADAQKVFYELDYYSYESGEIAINDDNGKFKLFHDGDSFGNGRIVDMGYFFD